VCRASACPAFRTSLSQSGEVRLYYYGAADSTICLATARLDSLLDAVFGAPRGD
jgi:predicted GH43/DUF377 family glycosyl hydrolase